MLCVAVVHSAAHRLSAGLARGAGGRGREHFFVRAGAELAQGWKRAPILGTEAPPIIYDDVVLDVCWCPAFTRWGLF